jgi:hypothetical protein
MSLWGIKNHNQRTKNDDAETPEEIWKVILKYIKKDKILWLPFYCNGLAGKIVDKLGYKNIHIKKDFFTYEPANYDLLIDNPPYSIKKKIIDRCYKLGKPFALLIPLETILYKYSLEKFQHDKDFQIIAIKKINFIRNGIQATGNNPMRFCWYCYKLNLPHRLILA